MPRDDTDTERERERDRDRERERRRRHRERERRHPRATEHSTREHDDAPPEEGVYIQHQQRRRRGHRATDSQGELLPPPSRRRDRGESAGADADRRYPSHDRYNNNSESEHAPAAPARARPKRPTGGAGTPSGSSGSAPLSLEALARLDKKNGKERGWDYDEGYLKEVRRREKELERERRRAEREAQRLREKEKEREEGEKRRAYESDATALDGARRRSERRREARRRTYTDDEREGEKGRAYAESEWEERKRRYKEKYTPSERAERREKRREEKRHRTEQKKRRVISGPLAEEGGIDDDDEYRYMMEKRGGAGSEPNDLTEEDLTRKKKIKRILIGVLAFLIVLAIIIPVAVMMSKKGNDKGGDTGGQAEGSDEKPENSNLADLDESSIPADKKGSILDPFSWYDTEDFNVTYTEKTVGGLPIMGLFDEWDDDAQANEHVPNLKKPFEYGKMPIRGVNLGGWLNIEPFITPSFFEKYSSKDGIIDEYTLCEKLGTDQCAKTLEKHYSSFVKKKTFEEIRDAGFDHVRIPFGYWMVTTYDGDPYVKQTSWRYLLRAIEWARQSGLRINLDLHGAPGSQNGWNHSGRQGAIGWLNGTDGELNAKRTLEIHHQLSTFFSQPRYKNIVTLYGIVNEPRMVDMDPSAVISWTSKAISQIRRDGITAVLVFGDGFFGLDNWQGKLQDDDNLLLDVHQYVIFNIDQISLKHTDKLKFACRGWTAQSQRSMDKKTGFGPTMCGEWSQADTDCTQYINNVGMGTRWEGTYNTGNASTSVLKPMCPAKDHTCSCDGANTPANEYSDAYKKWLLQFAVAQMRSFEEGWGWFYWTWDTEKAVQWSWKKGMAAGILPKKVWERDFDCQTFEDFEKMGLAETY